MVKKDSRETRKAKSPMHVLLNDLESGINSANGVLSRLWRMVLHDRNMTGHEWERLLQLWMAKTKDILGGDSNSLTNAKGNYSKTLAAPRMTWKLWMNGLQILNADNKYKRIRFEVHLVHTKGDKTDIIGIDVIDRRNDVKREESVGAFVSLKPGDTALPGGLYAPYDFENKEMEKVIIKCKSSMPISMAADCFNGYSIAGTLVLDEEGGISEDWAVVPVLK